MEAVAGVSSQSPSLATRRLISCRRSFEAERSTTIEPCGYEDREDDDSFHSSTTSREAGEEEGVGEEKAGEWEEAVGEGFSVGCMEAPWTVASDTTPSSRAKRTGSSDSHVSARTHADDGGGGERGGGGG